MIKKSLYSLFFFSLSLMPQNTPNFRVGDTIYYDQDGRITRIEGTNKFNVVKSKAIKNNKPFYNVQMFKKDSAFNNHLLYTDYHSYVLEVYSPNGFQIYYHKNGKKWAKGMTINNRKDGLWTYWYNNGQKMSIRKYSAQKKILKKSKPSELISFWDKNGNQTVENGTGDYFYFSEKDSSQYKGKIIKNKKDGFWFGIRKDSTKIYEELYKNGKLKQGKSWDKKGKEYSYKKVFEIPEYKNGMKGIKKVISKNYNIPKFALRNKISGSILLNFFINKQGEIENIKVVRKLCPPCDIEAIRVAKLLNKWKPAIRRGQTIRTRYTLPISYRIQ